MAQESTKTVRQRSDAEDALAEADVQSLHRMFNEKCDDLEKVIAGMGVIVEAGNTSPRPSETSISAMRDVAMAAIELARSVAIKETKD